MEKLRVCILVVLCAAGMLFPSYAYAENTQSIIVALGKDVPIDEELPEEYRVPEKYTENAVQFVTEDGVLLCGYVLGEGSRGITLGHANGWMVKSWLPFGERLVDAGFMIIIWEFRNIAPSGSAPESASLRWDLDVLAAAQVLREMGAAEIFAMGASDGGTATALAAPAIPDLVGLGILSSPKDSKGDAVTAIGKIKDVPAFFAVSSNDSYGDLYSHVKALYEACASTQKLFEVVEGFDHGTDMITPDVPGMGYSSLPKDDAQIAARRELADKLLRFVNKTFGNTTNKTDSATTAAPPSVSTEMPGQPQVPGATEPAAPDLKETRGRSENKGIVNMLLIGIVVLLVLIAITVFMLRRRRKR